MSIADVVMSGLIVCLIAALITIKQLRGNLASMDAVARFLAERLDACERDRDRNR